MEYALNTNPDIAEPGTGITTFRLGNNIRVRYPADHSKDDINYVLKYSTGHNLWETLATSVLSSSGNLETREALVPILLDTPQLFQLEIIR